MRRSHSIQRQRRGGGLIVALVTLLIVTTLMGSIIRSLLVELRQSRQQAIALQSHWLADAGIGRAASLLRKDTEYTGEQWKLDLGPNTTSATDGVSVIDIRVERQVMDQTTRLTVVATYPADQQRRATTEHVVLISEKPEKSPASEIRQEHHP